MLFTTAFALGAASLMLRSAAACLAVAGLLLLAFAAACLACGGLLSLSALLIAVCGFNAGLAAPCLLAVARGYSGFTR